MALHLEPAPSPRASRPTSSSWPGRSRRSTSSIAGCRASTSRVRNPDEAEEAATGQRVGSLPRSDHRRDAHPRRAVHLREPQELLPARGPARLLRDPPDLHGAPAVGARSRGWAAPAERRLARAVLPVPDRAHRGPREAPPRRAPGLQPAEERLPRRRVVRATCAGSRATWPAACVDRRGGPGAEAAARLPQLAAGRQLRPPRHRCGSAAAPTASCTRIRTLRSARSATRR